MNILFISAPGAGKGTQSKLLEKKYNLTSLSSGNIIRNIIKTGGELAENLNNIIKEGSFIQDELMMKLLSDELFNINKNLDNKGIIFDGFPRNIHQAELFEEFLEKHNLTIDFVINLDIDVELLKKRILNRLTCIECGNVYNSLMINTDKCESCNGKLINRVDDNIESIDKRYKKYINETIHLISYFEKRNNTKFISIFIEEKYSIEEIFYKIDNKLKEV